MAFLANLPFALAPGMGLNAFFAYTVVLQMGYSWQFALTAVLIEGILFIILTALNIREAIINCIPTSLKHGISVGIGLFIALMGLINAGIIESDAAGCDERLAYFAGERCSADRYICCHYCWHFS